MTYTQQQLCVHTEKQNKDNGMNAQSWLYNMGNMLEFLKVNPGT